MTNLSKTTFSLEEYVKRSFNYLDNMVDKECIPYFNIFWTEPAEAAHDWPCFVDVMSRQYQAVVMARRLTGISCIHEKTWSEKLKGNIEEDGLLHRPKAKYTDYEKAKGQAGLILYALVTAYADNPDDALETLIKNMVDGYYEKCKKYGIEDGLIGDGFIIIDLMAVVHTLQYKPALELAGMIVDDCFNRQKLFTGDNNFRHHSHMHGNLRTLAGAASYALYVRDPILLTRIDALYRFVRDETGTRFGYIPEETGRKDDIVMCETCALMDYIGLMSILANHGHPEYFDDMERLVRNHLVESQMLDGSWLKSDNSMEDTDQFSHRDVGERMVGAYAGWSSPTHILAAKENMFWGGPELRGKTRAFQNCCGGSGTHAYYIAWKDASRFHDGVLLVNLHIDKLLPQAEIRGYQPFKGLLTVSVRQACKVRVRIPSFTHTEHISLYINGTKAQVYSWGNYIELGSMAEGDYIEIKYPLPVYETIESIGNPGYRTYQYRVTWKGDTVIRMDPISHEYKTGYSHREKCDVDIYYGKEGPCPLYQREYMLDDAQPEKSVLFEDTSPIDFWANLT